MDSEKAFLVCLEKTDRLEGGDSNDAQDKGGFTRKGAIQGDCDEWADKHGLPRFSVRDLDEARRRQIFKELYYDRAGCAQLAEPLDFILYQYAVNFYFASAVKGLQIALQMGIVDGVLGKLTSEAAACLGWTQASERLLFQQVKHYRRAVDRSNHQLLTWLKAEPAARKPERPLDQRAFGPGWLNRCERAAKLAGFAWTAPPDQRAWMQEQHKQFKAEILPVC